MAATSSQDADDLTVRDLLAGAALSTIATAGLFVALSVGTLAYEWFAGRAPLADDPPLALLLEVVEFASIPAAAALLLSAAALSGPVWVQRRVRRVDAHLAVYTAAGATLGTLAGLWFLGGWDGVFGITFIFATALGAGVAVAARALAAWASRRPAVPSVLLVAIAVAVAAPGALWWIGALVPQLS
ncbi:hypothetical protein ER308_08910 [Egibacter rhizosphaerae]|uniref:Uncharacterized protein n=1 Tax=Egibacter rhizosphaerae TaxID=1670831 RepID=A0A411YEN1_9ACTN|nr:hypothetical protein [Egibacter rhizosphaerae]QBI19656.1 hypothetical protein ER308_08910 [Egibacter rhizosphaerae]